MNSLTRAVALVFLVLCAAFAKANTNALEALRSFPFSFVPADVAFDPHHPYLYATDLTGKKLLRVNLTNGVVTKQYQFSYQPERMTMTPDGSRLYVALLTRPHDHYWWDEDGHVGYIAEIDLATGNVLKQFRINEDPYDLVATDNGYLVVSGGSGQHTFIRSYRISDGINVGSTHISQRCRLSLHPGQTLVYAADTDISPSDIERFHLDPLTGALNNGGDSPYHGDFPMGGNVFAHPNGTNLITRGGGVYTSSPTLGLDMRHVRTLEGAPLDDLAFDLPHRSFFTVSNPNWWDSSFVSWVRCYNATTFELIRSFQQSSDLLFVGTYSNSLYVASSMAPGTVIHEYANPLVGAETNTPPNAEFVWAPTNTTTLVKIVFDASSSSDTLDPIGQLQFRWDWNDDGFYDTPFSGSPKATNRFNTAGTKTVALQVKDSFGAITAKQHTLNITLEADPGDPGGSNPPFELPFAAAHVVFDRLNPYLYATDSAAKRLAKVNLTNGFIERLFQFDFTPERMVITPNGRWMYVALRTPPRNPSWNDDSSEGYIAEFDLHAAVKTREFHIVQDPYDLAATDEGILVVSSASGQSSWLGSYNIATGVQLGSVYLFEETQITLHPSQSAIYFGEWSNHVRRYEIGSPGVLTNFAWFSLWPDYIDASKIVFLNATNSITSGGGIYYSSLARTNFQLVGKLEKGGFDDACQDADRGAFFTLGREPYSWTTELTAYNAQTMRPFATSQVPIGSQYLNARGDQLYVVSVETSGSRLHIYPSPALGMETNLPPQARFTLVDTNFTTRMPIAFDASLSSDDGSNSNLGYRWDWDNDGVFDTAFTNTPLATKRFTIAGTKTVVLQVVDRFGATAISSRTFEVLLEADPGVPGTSTEPYNLPFVAANVIFDPGAPCLYATDSVSRKLVKVNLTTGLVEREFHFEFTPERMAITPNGRWMYVALLLESHVDYSFGSMAASGYIAEFDLHAGVKTREFLIDQDPYDLAATDNGLLLVSGGSGYSAEISSYEIATGVRKGTFSSVGPRTLITLHPSQAAVYFNDSSWMVEKLEINGAGALAHAYYYDNSSWNIGKLFFATPTTSLAAGGGIYALSEARTEFNKIGTLTNGGFEDMVVDPANNGLLTVSGRPSWDSSVPGKCAVYEMSSLAPVYSFPITNSVRYVGLAAESVYFVYIGASASMIDWMPNPMIGTSTNTAPLADFTWSPALPVTFSPAIFDSSLSNDNLDRPDQLLYRWDWNGDGIFDTDFARRTNTVVQLKSFGPRKVTLEVKDRLGLTNRITKTVTVAAVPDFGESFTGTNAPFTLPFSPIHSAFDPVRPFLYAIDSDGKKLVKMNVTNGIIERVFSFERRPKRISITPNGARMYVATGEIDDTEQYTYPGRGAVAEFDLEAGTRTQELEIALRPSGIAASDEGFFAVTGHASSSWGRFSIYSRTNGLLVGERTISYPDITIAFDQFQNAFYVDGRQFVVHSKSGAIDSDRPSQLWGDVFVHPNGHHLLTTDGYIYQKTNSTRVFEGDLNVGSPHAVHFDTNESALFFYSYYDLRGFNSDTFHFTGSLQFNTGLLSIGTRENILFALIPTASGASVLRLPHPMFGSRTNTPPTADFTWTPNPATTVLPLQFDATSTSDSSDPIGALEFRWDFDGNGSFETFTGNIPHALRRFWRGGFHRVGLQVIDRFGRGGAVYKEFFVRATRTVTEGDMLWRNKDGRYAIWFMEGDTRTGVSTLGSGETLSAGWKVAGLADFNRDGQADILWTFAQRLAKVWYMNGTELLYSAPLRLKLPYNWYLVGVADFNQDTHSDLLLKHREGNVAVWFMNGTNFVSSEVLRDGQPVAPGWSVAGIGDLNGDYHPDIVWRHLDRRLAAWFMSQTTITSARSLTGPAMPLLWQVVGVADFNRDGKSDILWRNRDGEVGAWVMNGERTQTFLPLVREGQVRREWQLLNNP